MSHPVFALKEIEQKWQRIWKERPEGLSAGGLSGTVQLRYVLPWAGGDEPWGWPVLRRIACADVYARHLSQQGKRPFSSHTVEGFLETGSAPGSKGGVAGKEELARLGEAKRALGIADDHASVVLTSDPAGCRVTQWVFLELLRRNLVYRLWRPALACPRCFRTFSPRERISVCPRCSERLEERESPQWRVDLLPYAERLFSDVEKSSWSPEARKQQKAVIGRRRGTEVVFPVSRPYEGEYEQVPVFTTRVESIYGVKFLLIAPRHPILEKVLDPAYEEDVLGYQQNLARGLEPRVSGVRTGGFALNPANLERVPVLVSPLAETPYSDGVAMGVPAHDRELFELARRLRLPIREVIHSSTAKFDHDGKLVEPYIGEGTLTNSGPFSGLGSRSGRERISNLLSRRSMCRKTTRYALRSLPLSELSLSGPPVPLIHCEACGCVPVAEDRLPVELPGSTEELRASGAESLAALPDFVNLACPLCGGEARRDPGTILPWLGRAWSYLAHPLGGPDGVLAWKTGAEDPPAGEAPAGEGREEGEDDTTAEDRVEPEASEEPAGASEPATSEKDERETAEPRPAEEGGAATGGGESPGGDGPAASAKESVPVGPTGEGPPEGTPETDGEDASGEGDASSRDEAPSRDTRGEGAGGSARVTPVAGGPAAPAGDGPPPPETPPPKRRGEADGEEDPGTDRASSEAPTDGPAHLAVAPSLVLQRLLPVDIVYASPRFTPKEIVGTRFLTKFLHDRRQVPVFEPFRRFFRVGDLALEERAGREPASGDPSVRDDDLASVSALLERYGGDALRLALFALGPLGGRVSFSHGHLRSLRCFVHRVWNEVNLRMEKGRFVSRRVLEQKHVTIYRVTERLRRMKFHTAFSAVREFVKFLISPETTEEEMDRSSLETFVIVLSPFAPHCAQELWERLGHEGSVLEARWPDHSPELIAPQRREITIWVDGKVRDRMTQPADLPLNRLESLALEREKIQSRIGSRRIRRVVSLPGRLVSIALEEDDEASDVRRTENA